MYIITSIEAHPVGHTAIMSETVRDRGKPSILSEVVQSFIWRRKKTERDRENPLIYYPKLSKPAITDLIHKGNINANTNMNSLSECFNPNVLFTVKATKLCWLAGSLDAYRLNDDSKLCSFWLCWVFCVKIPSTQ
jgi:hypothetical protein